MSKTLDTDSVESNNTVMTNMTIYKVDASTTKILKQAAAIQYPDWPHSPLSKWARETLLTAARKVIEDEEQAKIVQV